MQGYEAMLPLSNHLAFQVNTIDSLCEAVETRLGARFVKLPGVAASCDAKAVYRALPNGQLWGCDYGMPVALSFGESDYIRVQFGRTGAGRTRMGGEQVPVTPERACVSGAAAEIDFGEGFKQLVWRVPVTFLIQKLAALAGQAVTGGLQFDPAIDLAAPTARNLTNILSCLVGAADTLHDTGSAIVLAELEQALASALLSAGRHNQRHLLERPAPAAGPWQVHRAESFIEANWRKPLCIEDIVTATGASARSIYRSFTTHRGCSPMEFLRRIRLQHARRMLEAGDPAVSVTDVAFDCGFGDLSRFSKDFRAAYGESPSALLKRRRDGSLPGRHQAV